MFYLFWASGKWVSTKTVEQLKLINKTQVTKKKITQDYIQIFLLKS